jgi:hypothetical protein
MAAMAGAALQSLVFVGLMTSWGCAGPDGRPSLLADAHWDAPASAQRFLSRFPPSANEGELIAWLESNNFMVDRNAGRASRLVHSLPCNERIEITWSKLSDNVIGRAEARVSEAGCL